MKNLLKPSFNKLKNSKAFGVYTGVCAIFVAAAALALQSGMIINNKVTTDEIIAITNVRIFDGEEVLDERIVVINGAYIQAVGGEAPVGATVIDGQGATLMPGFIDSHTHTDMDGLRDALKFGVTTELELNGNWSARKRREISERSDIADLRSSGMGVTAEGGHPTQYMSSSSNWLIRLFYKYPSVNSPDEAVRFVNQQIERGADYIKIFIEDGSVVGYPGLPVLDNDILVAAINETHRQGKLAIVHATTVETARQALDAGVDGFAHLFFDKAPSPELIADIAASGAFVTPTLVVISSALGNSATELASDPRVSSRLDKKWLEHLSRSMNVYPEGNLEDVYAAVRALRDAGVDILAGSDVSEPISILGGLAHGASLHHELQLLVAAGLEPIEALRAATSTPARRYGLTDRGRIAPGALADLILVDGDPLANISDTLSIRSVWRRGVKQAETAF